VSNLNDLYLSLRYYAFEEYLEIPTFINQMVLLFQANALPESWREFDFTVYGKIANRLKLTLPGQEVSIYSTHSQAGQREFFDWKKLMTMLTLLGAPLPSQADLDQYQTELLQKAEHENSGFISREHFI
jgi:hypothetical protein